MKIILEANDIEKLIKEKYGDCEIKSGLDSETEIVISMEELPTIKKPVRATPVQEAPPKKQVVLPGGSVDANASGLTLEPRQHTVPGGAMGKSRGGMPVY